MVLCVVAALPMELPREKRFIKGKKFPLLNREEDICWAVTGVGQHNVSRFYRYLDQNGLEFNWIVVVGFAGSLDKTLRKGRVVCYDSLIRPPGEIFWLKILAGYRQVVGLEVSKWTGPEKKAQWKQLFSAAEVVDMESATHAEECRKRGWELSVLRIVSDGAKERLPLVRYIVEQWKDVPWKRMWQHPLHFIHGVWFSLRLWCYAKKLGYEVKKIVGHVLSSKAMKGEKQ